MRLYGLLSEECGSWEYHWDEPPEPGCDVYLIAAESRAKAVYMWKQKRGDAWVDLPRYSCRLLGEFDDHAGILDDNRLPEALYDYWWDRFAEVMPSEVKAHA